MQMAQQNHCPCLREWTIPRLLEQPLDAGKMGYNPSSYSMLLKLEFNKKALRVTYKTPSATIPETVPCAATFEANMIAPAKAEIFENDILKCKKPVRVQKNIM